MKELSSSSVCVGGGFQMQIFDKKYVVLFIYVYLYIRNVNLNWTV